MPFLFAGSQDAHPVPILGQIGQIEKNAERSGDNASRRLIERCDQLSQFRLGVRRAGSPITRNFANFFDMIQRLRASQIADHIAEHVAQKAHVATQQFIVNHGQDGFA